MREQFRYRMLIELHRSSETYHARVPAFDVHGVGETLEEAARVAREKVFEKIAELEAQRRRVPEPDSAADYSGQFRLRMPRALHQRLARMAQDEETSLNYMVLQLIAEGLGKRARRRPRRP